MKMHVHTARSLARMCRAAEQIAKAGQIATASNNDVWPRARQPFRAVGGTWLAVLCVAQSAVQAIY